MRNISMLGNLIIRQVRNISKFFDIWDQTPQDVSVMINHILFKSNQPDEFWLTIAQMQLSNQTKFALFNYREIFRDQYEKEK